MYDIGMIPWQDRPRGLPLGKPRGLCENINTIPGDDQPAGGFSIGLVLVHIARTTCFKRHLYCATPVISVVDIDIGNLGSRSGGQTALQKSWIFFRSLEEIHNNPEKAY